MADIHDRLTERDRGAKAKQLLENPLWVEAWEKIQSGLIDSWQNSRPDDSARREHIYLQLDAVRAVKRNFEQIVLTGDMAEIAIEQERSNERRS